MNYEVIILNIYSLEIAAIYRNCFMAVGIGFIWHTKNIIVVDFPYTSIQFKRLHMLNYT